MFMTPPTSCLPDGATKSFDPIFECTRPGLDLPLTPPISESRTLRGHSDGTNMDAARRQLFPSPSFHEDTE